MTYKWQDLTKRQQDAARRARAQLADDGYGASVSQLAKYLDDSMAYVRGEITAGQLAPIVSAVKA